MKWNMTFGPAAQAKIDKQIGQMIAKHKTAVTIIYVAELLGVSPEIAADWLVVKVAAFRGCAEADIVEQLAAATQEVEKGVLAWEATMELEP